MAKDYGDPFPSDEDDILPTNKTANFSEIDYRINESLSRRPPSNLLKSPAELVPPTGDEQKPGQRVTFTGLITKIEKDNDRRSPTFGFNTRYWVMRQDFKRGVAFLAGNESPEYCNLRIGDEVQLTQGEIQGQWRIIGPTKKTLTPTIALTGSADPTDTETLINWPSVLFTTDDDNVFTVDPDDQSKITIQCIDQIQIDLSLKAIVSLANAKSRDQIPVLTDIRINEDEDYIEAKVGMIDGSYRTPPAWADKIQLTKCTYD